MKLIFQVTIVLVLTFVLSGCTVAQPIEPNAVNTEPEVLDHIPGSSDQILQPEESDNSEGISLSDDEVLTVEVKDFSYFPKSITAKAGTTITISLNNTKGMHDFVIDELGVQSKLLNTGESEELVINIPEDAKGKTFEYYCSVGNHRQMGMVGKLIVE